MATLHSDLDSAVVEALDAAIDQSPEFKRRLRKLIENATTSNLRDDDVREVIELATVDDSLED